MVKEETMAAPFTPFSSYQSCSYCIPLLKNTSTIVRTSSIKFENGTWSFSSQCLQEDSIFSHVILVTVMSECYCFAGKTPLLIVHVCRFGHEEIRKDNSSITWYT